MEAAPSRLISGWTVDSRVATTEAFPNPKGWEELSSEHLTEEHDG